MLACKDRYGEHGGWAHTLRLYCTKAHRLRLFLHRYGEHAGWAHTILFAADLTKFKASPLVEAQ
jgi:hypothetical protein